MNKSIFKRAINEVKVRNHNPSRISTHEYDGNQEEIFSRIKTKKTVIDRIKKVNRDQSYKRRID